MEKINKKKLKLFFCINDLQRGGAEKQLNYISNYLNNFYDISIFVLGNKKVEYNFEKKIKIFKIKNFLFLYQFLNEIFKQKPKIIFFALPKAYFIFGLISLFFPSIKKILLRRSLNYYHTNIFYRYYEIFLHKFTSYFVCNSYAAKNDLVSKENVSKKRVMVIDNYIEYVKTKFKQKTKSKEFKILCISNFHNYKGHFLILKTIKILENLPIKIYFFGKDKDITKKDIINEALKLNIRDKIIFIKKINQNYGFPNFSLGILFSKTESFPNAILEYFSLKLPVLAFDTGDVRRLVDDKNGKMFKSRNPISISKKIKDLFYSPKLDTKSRNSLFKLKIYSNKKKNLDKYVQLINKVVNH